MRLEGSEEMEGSFCHFSVRRHGFECVARVVSSGDGAMVSMVGQAWAVNHDVFLIEIFCWRATCGLLPSCSQLNRDAKVLLIESEGFLGGAATHRGVNSYCGLYSIEEKPRQAVGQIWNELHDFCPTLRQQPREDTACTRRALSRARPPEALEACWGVRLSGRRRRGRLRAEHSVPDKTLGSPNPAGSE